MVTALQSATKPVTGAPTSYADMVDYSRIYAELQRRGIPLSEDDKQKCQAICTAELRKHGGGSAFGNGFGLLETLPYMLISFIQNIPKMLSGDFKGLSDITSRFGAAASDTNEQTKIWQLQQAEARIAARMLDMRATNPNLAAASEYITRVKPASDDSAPKLLDASIANQVSKASGFTRSVDMDTSLDNGRAAFAEATPTSGLPAKASSRALTGRS